MDEHYDESPSPGMSMTKWIIACLFLWFIVGMCMGSPPDAGSYTIYLSEPMNVDIVDPTKEVTVLQADKYEWANYGQTLRIEMLGRVVLIPTSKIKFIEIWDTANQQRRE